MIGEILMETKQKLMDSAFRLFAKKGTEFSLSEVAKEVGIQKASIYAHFPSKQDLLYAVIDREISQYFFEIYEDCLNLKDIYYMILKYYHESKPTLYFWKRLLLFPPKVYEKTISLKIKTLSDKRYEVIKEIVKLNIENGIIKNRDADSVAVSYISMIHGLMSSMIIYGTQNLKLHYDDIWQNFWNGIT
jgi:AcrR family transcriptional regulator